ncbi:MAG TPA: hypothetical protein PKO12_03440 [Holophaga sp.]|nr:hypothetical protein [Holophaga sp.]
MRIQTLSYFLGTGALLAFVACGGGGGGKSSKATKLHYTDPNTTGWRLVVGTGQDSAQLQLKLMPPDGVVAKGASFFLTCDGTRATWGTTTAGTAFDLGNAPQIFRAKAGDTSADLQVGLYQKTGTTTLASTQDVARLTLALASGAKDGSVALNTTAGKQAVYLDASGNTQSISIAVGELTAD